MSIGHGGVSHWRCRTPSCRPFYLSCFSWPIEFRSRPPTWSGLYLPLVALRLSRPGDRIHPRYDGSKLWQARGSPARQQSFASRRRAVASALHYAMDNPISNNETGGGYVSRPEKSPGRLAASTPGRPSLPIVSLSQSAVAHKQPYAMCPRALSASRHIKSGSRSPRDVSSMIFLATSMVSGSSRSARLRALHAPSWAADMISMVSGSKAAS
jgi:hypothetical protein